MKLCVHNHQGPMRYGAKEWLGVVNNTDPALVTMRVAVNTSGNPGMAKGGSGDLLTGLIAGLLAQFPHDPAQAVEAAVYLHGLADRLAVRDSDERHAAAHGFSCDIWPRSVQSHAHDFAAVGGYNDRDVTLSWMPLTHDMGLIGFYLVQFATRAQCTSCPPICSCAGRCSGCRWPRESAPPSPARRTSATGISSKCSTAGAWRTWICPASLDLQRRRAHLRAAVQ